MVHEDVLVHTSIKMDSQLFKMNGLPNLCKVSQHYYPTDLKRTSLN